jgi:hypothetical protein
MKRLTCAAVSSLMVMSFITPVRAESTPAITAQSRSTIEEMFFRQRVLTDELQTLMAQMKMMMAEMNTLTTPPTEKPVTMADLHKQQQLLIARVDSLIGRSRLDTLSPKPATAATVQDVYQQQVVMMAEMKEMMAEMKRMMVVYRGRATDRTP